MRKVFIVGSLTGTVVTRFNHDMLSFFRETELVVVDFIETFNDLLETIRCNKECYILYCPTKIPKKIQSRLVKNDAQVFDILGDQKVTLGHIKLNNGMIQKVVLSFSGKGQINKTFFPRKKKEPFYKHLHLQYRTS